VLIFVYRDGEIRAAIFTPAAAGACFKVGGYGESILSGGKDLAGAESDADAAFLAPPFVDVNPVHRGEQNRFGRSIS
jgi:hypothetical protein